MSRLPRKAVRKFAGRRRLAVVVLTAVLMLLASSPLAVAQSQGRGKKKPPEAPAAVPFNAGEKLEYAAQWNGFLTAATVELAVMERREFFGGQAWHFQALAQTIDPVRKLFALDDQFDSYTDTITLASRQYESYLREQSRREDLVVPMSTTADTGRSNRRVYVVFPGTTDPLGMIYRLRAVEWNKEPEAHLRVFDGRKFYDVEARREAAGGRVTVAAGSFAVTRLALRILQDGVEMPNLKVWISIGDDAAHTPVLMEAEASIGTVRVELTAKSGP